jgi:nucleotide-binding universal stress UspA family protein
MFTNILWATDGSEAADHALETAKTLAADGKLTVLHCKELMLGRSAGHPVYADEDDLVDKVRKQVDELRAAGVDATFRLETAMASGSAHTIADVAREIDADVVVVGTRGHTPLAGLLLGSVTQRLLHIAPCPVLAIPTTKAAASAAAEREEHALAH